MDIWRACEEGKFGLVKRYVDRGHDLEAIDPEWKRTPLLLASEHGHANIVKFLIEKGANIEAQGYDGDRALMLASWKGHEEIVKILIAKGANVNASDIRKMGVATLNYEWTALMYASKRGYMGIVKILMENDADINSRSSNGTTPLMLASCDTPSP